MKIKYTLAKKHYPVGAANMADFVDLANDLGCDYLQDLNKGLNAKYTSERVMLEILACLAAVVRDNVLKEARTSAYIGLQADETTYVSVSKQLISYIRYVKVTIFH